jgi:hypothetical protein
MQKISKRILSDSRGVTAVEFALIMPFFFLLLFAIVDFGWYFYSQHTIQFATAREPGLPLSEFNSRTKTAMNEPGRFDHKDNPG